MKAVTKQKADERRDRGTYTIRKNNSALVFWTFLICILVVFSFKCAQLVCRYVSNLASK